MQSLIEGYIAMRNRQQLDHNWLWSYYKSEGGKLDNPTEFITNFYYIQTPIQVNGQILGYQRTNRDLSTFFTDMDKKFQLNTLWDKEGNFIKVVI